MPSTCATALVERVVHHADIVKIEGDSYRLRESEVSANTRRESMPREEERYDEDLTAPRAPRRSLLDGEPLGIVRRDVGSS